MFRNRISALRTGALAAAMLAFAATPAFAQHHGGGGHGGHGGGHAGNFHGHTGSFHGGHVGGYHGGGYYHGGYYGHGYYGRGYYGRGIGVYAWPYLGSYGYSGYYYPSYSSYYYAPDYYAPDYYYPPAVSGYYSPPDVEVYPPSSPAPAPAADVATVEVRVPPDAQVWFDGNPTTQTGELRTYASPPLSPDKAFHYDVRARWTDNGRVVDQTRSVEVRAGRRTTVDFMQPQP